ncbi:MAG: hypothetical protein J5I65_03220 [Aridibacter famidurans]|nr:hypothetical protein [Aridibacter famidurans]
MWFAIFITLLLTFQCESIEDGWKGIKPLKTSRGDVERILKSPTTEIAGSFGYVDGNIFIRVLYSTSPCEKDEYGRGYLSVPADRVLTYYVIFKKRVEISELKFNREEFRRDESGDVEGVITYFNADYSILISVKQEGAKELVTSISFKPSAEQIAAFVCEKK